MVELPTLGRRSPGTLAKDAAASCALGAAGQRRRRSPGGHVFHSILGLLNVQTSVYGSVLDVSAACQRSGHRSGACTGTPVARIFGAGGRDTYRRVGGDLATASNPPRRSGVRASAFGRRTSAYCEFKAKPRSPSRRFVSRVTKGWQCVGHLLTDVYAVPDDASIEPTGTRAAPRKTRHTGCDEPLAMKREYTGPRLRLPRAMAASFHPNRSRPCLQLASMSAVPALPF